MVIKKSFEILITVSLAFLSCSQPSNQLKEKETPQQKQETVFRKTDSSLIKAALRKSVFIYKYGDFSVAPQYHSSYIIKVTPEKVYLSIDNYGNILSTNSFILSKEAFKSFVTSFLNLHIQSKNEVQNTGCAGGSSASFEIYIGDSKQLEVYEYDCGGTRFGNLDGNGLAAINLFRTMVPDLNEKINASRK